MGLKLSTSGGGAVHLQPASSIATDVTLTVPVTGGEIPLKDGSGNISTAGTVTAASFVGSGAGLTGIAGGFSNMQVFTSTGTFTVPAGVTKAKVTVYGGGGGGGNANGASVGNNSNSGGGGGSGGCAIKIVSGLTPGATVSVTVGSGGTSMTAGGTSSFGAHCSATGGGAGASGITTTTPYKPTPGTAGAGSGGDVNLTGNRGCAQVAYEVITGGGNSTSNVSQQACCGGNGINNIGIGGLVNTSGWTGSNASGYSAGGGAATGRSSFNTTYNGGTGGGGIVIVEY